MHQTQCGFRVHRNFSCTGKIIRSSQRDQPNARQERGVLSAFCQRRGNLAQGAIASRRDHCINACNNSFRYMALRIPGLPGDAHVQSYAGRAQRLYRRSQTLITGRFAVEDQPPMCRCCHHRRLARRCERMMQEQREIRSAVMPVSHAARMIRVHRKDDGRAGRPLFPEADAAPLPRRRLFFQLPRRTASTSAFIRRITSA